MIDVRHEGNPATADHVIVTYARDGKIRKVRAKAVVMASGGWVNRNIVTDLPDAHTAAYKEFHYGPVLTANVALRNWRFFDKLGFINARWFEGLGWQVCVRRNVAFGGTKALTPDDPTVLTFYIPFLSPELPPSAQGPAGRARLLATSYADFEHQIRTADVGDVRLCRLRRAARHRGHHPESLGACITVRLSPVSFWGGMDMRRLTRCCASRTDESFSHTPSSRA